MYLQIDNIVSAGNKPFRVKKERHLETFKRKAVKVLGNDALEFNEVIITLTSGIYNVSVPYYFERLEKVINATMYAAQRAKGVYIAAICKPDLTVAFAKAA